MRYLDSYRLLLLRLGLLLLIYTGCRALFLGLNFQDFSTIENAEIVFGFVHGWRFDISTIFYINAIFILLSLLPFAFVLHQKYQQFLKIFFFLTNFLFIIPNLSDTEYIKFTGKRMDISVFTISQDIGDQSSQLLLNYWYLVLLFFLCAFLFWRYYPNNYKHHKKLNSFYSIGLFLIVSGLILLGMRGGFQKRPIQLLTAFSKGTEIGNLTLNTPFSILMSLDKQRLKRIHYFNESDLEQKIPIPLGADSVAYPRQNVVLLIVESFGAEYMGFMNPYQGYTPFLDSLAQQGQFFNQVIANGSTSAQSAPSLLIGFPALMEMSILFSNYQNNEFFSPYQFLEKEGYQSYFFHGGNNGTMGFDIFTKNLGFQYFGLNEYPHKGDHDGNWGIFDEPYLKYCAKYLEKEKQPFLATIFTLSSHQPYTIPTEYQGKFRKGTHPIHESVGYTDYSLQQFFEYAQTTSWYDSTLFIITADHTNQTMEKAYKNRIGDLKLPLLLFHPSGNLPTIDTDRMVQQTDIPASILDYLGFSPKQLPKFSRSFFNAQNTEEALFYLQENYYYIKPGYYIRHFNDQFILYDWKDKRLPDSQIKQEDVEKLKAYIQYFNNGMIDNKF